MVPIHDSDIAAERWNQSEWKHYELWEKIEVKLRRRRLIWIAGTVFVFLALSSIPILISHWPKWNSLRAARVLGDKINEAKRLSGSEGQAFRIEFPDGKTLSYTLIKLPSCVAPSSAGTVVESGTLLDSAHLGQYALISPEEGRELQIPGLVSSFCYDPLSGSSETLTDQSVSGFGIIPVKDLAEKRQDRMSLVIFKGPSAEVSFE